MKIKEYGILIITLIFSFISNIFGIIIREYIKYLKFWVTFLGMVLHGKSCICLILAIIITFFLDLLNWF